MAHSKKMQVLYSTTFTYMTPPIMLSQSLPKILVNNSIQTFAYMTGELFLALRLGKPKIKFHYPYHTVTATRQLMEC